MLIAKHIIDYPRDLLCHCVVLRYNQMIYRLFSKRGTLTEDTKIRQMPYEAIAVANYLIERAKAFGEALTPMKVQKLVYFAHGWNLAIYNQPLLRERIEAWKFGPVVPQLYHELKRFGSEGIPGPVSVYRFKGARLSTQVPTVEECEGYTPVTAELLDRIWTIYGGYSAVQLSNATHAHGSPWEVTRTRTGGASHAVIDDDLIRDDFLKRARRQAEPQAAHAAART